MAERLTTKNYQAAIEYLYGSRYPGSFPFGAYDHDFGNDVALSFCSQDLSTSKHGFSLDMNDIFRVDRACLLGAREQIIYQVPAAGALATQTVFVATRGMVITGITEIHSTAETAAGTATAAIFKDTGTLAPGKGASVMVGTFNLKATANTLQTATLLAVDGAGNPNAGIMLAQGDRLTVVVAGTATITALAGVVFSIQTAPGYKEQAAICVVPSSIATVGFFLANRDYQVVGAQLVYSAAAAGAGTITLDVTQETTTGAPGSGTSILAAAQSVNSATAANTVYNLALSATAANLIVRNGNRLSLKATGTMTGLAGVCLCVYLQSLTTGYIGQIDIPISIPTNANVATQGMWVADRDYEIMDASGVASTASGGGGTATFTIDKGVVAPGAGTAALTGTLDLSTTANTVLVGVQNVSRRTRLLNAGDLLSIKIASPASTAGVLATVSLMPR
jgi:hypothetical protein